MSEPNTYTELDAANHEAMEAGFETSYAKRLLEVLGSGAHWFFTGVVVDTEQRGSVCACGAAIRYEFIIQHKTTGQKLKLGSTCIGVFQGVNPETYEAMRAEVRKMRKVASELLKQKKTAERQAAVSEYKAAHDLSYASVTGAIKDFRAGLEGKYNQATIENWFKTLRTQLEGVRAVAPNYTRESDFIAWYERQAQLLETLEAAFEASQADFARWHTDSTYAVRLPDGTLVEAQAIGVLMTNLMGFPELTPIFTAMNVATGWWGFSDSTKVKMLAEYGAIEIVPTENTPQWFQAKATKGKKAKLQAALAFK